MADFGDYFKENMNSLGMPTPDSLAANLGAALGSAQLIATAAEKYGAEVTIGELIGAGLLTEVLGVAAAVGAAAYLGAVVGSIAVAAGRSISDGTSIADLFAPDIDFGINSNVNTRWRNAHTPPRRDPLAIDLDGDGIETVGMPSGVSPILFDHDADSVKTGTGWLKGDDAWLVLDRNSNGTIDSGRELFGVDTMITVQETVNVPGSAPISQTVTRNARTGFEALSTLDDNHDGVFDSRDSQFVNVKLWQDLNQDGVSQSNELFTLAGKGISAISLNASSTTTNLGNGNTVTGQATVTRTSGSTTSIDSVDLQASNLNLADNPFYRQFSDTIPLTDAARALPGMGGSGWLRDMREAMSLGSTQAQLFTQDVSGFAASTSRDQQLSKLDAMIDAWADTSDRVDRSDLRPVAGTVISDDGVYRTTRYTAMDPANYPDPSKALVPCADFRLPAEYYEWSYPSYSPVPVLVLNAAGKEVMRRLGDLEAFNGARFINFTITESVTAAGGGSGTGGGGGTSGGEAPSSGYITRWLINLEPEQIASINQAYDALSQSVYSALVVQTRLRPYLAAINLVIEGTSARVDTTPLTEKLDASKAADLRKALIDLVELNKYATSTLVALGYDGIAKLRGWIESLPVDSPLRTDLPALDVIVGSARPGSDRNDIFLGDASANAYTAGGGNDVLDGKAGDDNLAGENGEDVLFGGDGNDLIQGGAGDDYLDGGAGNDIVAGGVYDTWNGIYNGAGNDTYQFGRGDGQDRIYDSDSTAGNVDKIIFKTGVAVADVIASRDSDALVLKINGTTDQLRVENYFGTDAANGWQIEEIRFTDAALTVWTVADIKAKVLMSSAGNDIIVGYASADTFAGGDGSDTLWGRDGNDTLAGGTGDDGLYGENGDDKLTGDAGNDVLQGGSGNDTVDGGAGNDILAGGVYDTWNAIYNGAGNDAYQFGRGDGQDRIYDFDPTAGNVDKIVFKTGVAVADVVVSRDSDALVLKINGTTDQLRVENYFGTDATNGWQIEEIRFTDSSATVWTVADIKAKVLTGGAGNDIIVGYASADTLTGGDGSDTLWGRDGNDTLAGGTGDDGLYGENGDDKLTGDAGNDVLQGGSGNDTLDGGAGNDILAGGVYDTWNAIYNGAGNDTYQFGRGDGQDRIYDFDPTAGNLDKIVFKTGVAVADVVLSRDTDALVLKISGTTDQLRVENYFGADATNGWQIEEIRFTDSSATVWKVADIKAKVLTGGAGNDIIVGYASADTLTGGDGSDTLWGRDGNDTLAGGTGDDGLYGENGDDKLTGDAGNDVLQGGSGNDTLDGGAGNDILAGGVYDTWNAIYNGAGNDTYQFGRGDGQDRIYDFDPTAGNLDKIVFKAGVAVADVTVSRDSDALVLKINGTTDQLRVENYFGSDATNGWQVEEIRFTDSSTTVWRVADVKAKALTGGAGNDTIVGYASADTLTGGDGSDTLWGRDGNDMLAGGTGDDGLYGENGDDKLTGDAGNDVLQGGSGNDTLDGGAGNDILAGGVYDTWNAIYNGAGNDTYQFGKGDGQDRIYDFDPTAGNVDKIVFKTGVAVADVTLSRDSDALVLKINGTTDQLRVENYFGTDATNGWQAEEIRFTDSSATVWTVADVKARVLAGGAGNDTIVGYASADTLTGGDGSDILWGHDGNDSLAGGNGDDSLLGETGDDILDGGAGNDSLIGGVGNNTYLFGKGDGQDLVRVTNDATVGKLNTLLFKTGIAPSEVALRLVFDNDMGGNVALEASIAGTADKITFDGFLYGDDPANSYNSLQQIRFADGTAWDTVTIRSMLASTVISGTAAADTLVGSSTAEQLLGLDGNDSLNAGAGNDFLDGGTGSDTLTGGTGDDAYVVDALTDVVNELANEGTDTVRSSITWTLGANLENLVLTGAAAINGTGNAVGNRLYGNAAANILNGDQGADVMAAGAGNDTYVVDNIGDAVVELAGEGTDLVQANVTFTLASNIENLTLTGAAAINATGNALDNALVGNGAANILYGAGGNDNLNGGAGADTMFGGLGNDTYVMDIGTDVAAENANEGTDTVTTALTWTLGANLENLTLTGSASVNGTGNELNNSVIGNGAANVLTGLAGDDVLNGGGGADTLIGGLGSDSYFVENVGDATIENAGEGTDTVLATITWTTLAPNVENLILMGSAAIDGTGNAADNAISGNAGANKLYGGAGNDTISGAGGADMLVGGLGNDTYTVDDVGDVTVEAAGEGVDLVYAGLNWTLGANIENLTLNGSASVNGTGNTLDNVLTGNSAANVLTGDAGNDTLNGGAGSDTMLGGVGNDTYVVDNLGDAVTESANEGTDAVMSSITWSLGANVENLTLTGSSALNGTGNTLSNVLVGNVAANTLNGGTGADTMSGGVGNDTYVVDDVADLVTENAGEGTDLVQSSVTYTLASNLENLTLTGTSAVDGTGNSLDNVLSGNSANNILVGGAGNDTYDGGAGSDTLTDSSTTSNETYKWGVGSGIDTIQDSGGSLDHIDVFAGTTQSQLAFVHNGNNLEVSITGQADKLIVKDWYLSSANQIEEFRFSGGSKVLASQVQSLLSAMAGFAAPVALETGAQNIRNVGSMVYLTPNAMM